MSKYNGHRNYNHWNVSLWLFNDEALYDLVCDHYRYGKRTGCNKDQIALELLDALPPRTPDGVRYTKTSVRAALVGFSV